MKNYRLVLDNNGTVKVFKKFWEKQGVNDDVVHPLLAYADQKIYDEYLQDKF
jgi:hypothetical protein